MKEKELRKKSKCVLCGKLFGHTGLPFFWTVHLKRHGLMGRAVRAQSGLEMVMGSTALAQVMGPNEEMTKTLFSKGFTVCEDCSTEKRICIAQLAESV